jgi:DNA-binding NarL/FixJ family response regulator
MNKNKLTSREKEIVHLVAKGKMLKEIAADLNIVESTLNSHQKNIHLKTSTRSMAELVIWAGSHPEELE